MSALEGTFYVNETVQFGLRNDTCASISSAVMERGALKKFPDPFHETAMKHTHKRVVGRDGAYIAMMPAFLMLSFFYWNSNDKNGIILLMHFTLQGLLSKLTRRIDKCETKKVGVDLFVSTYSLKSNCSWLIL